MRDFDEDRPSITGRKIASNIPPTVPGYVETKKWLPWIYLIYGGAAAIVILVVWLFRK
jgi:hypothetical protein